MHKLVIVTTVPETLSTILRGQPEWLNQHFDVACITSSDSSKRFDVNDAVQVYRVNMSRGISPIRDLISILKMCFVLRDIKPDIVHSYTPKAGLVAMLAAFLSRVPVRIHTFTGLIFPTQKGLKQQLLLNIDRLICFAATHVVPEGKGVMNDLSRFRVTHKPMRIIGNGNIAGVDIGHFSVNQSPGDFKIGNGFTFCYVGRLNRDKGIQELVAAFSELEGCPRLILVGQLDESAPVSADTLELIRSHPRIQALGFLDDIRPVLSVSNVLVLPSYREGFPNVILQAGAMGVPVIASDINGCNEVIDDGFNGWLVTPRDIVGLKLAMAKAMSLDANEFHRLKRNARERVVERFERSKYLNSLLSFYEGVIN